MADIFVSYEKRDREFVRRLVTALEAAGWSVFWDRKIATGESWRAALEAALKEMSCMIVVWSQHSIQSDWVIDEAGDGRSRGKLLPLTIEDIQPPHGFRQIQTLAFGDWDGTDEAACFRQLLQDLRALTAKSGAHTSSSLGGAQQPVQRPESIKEAVAEGVSDSAARPRTKAADAGTSTRSTDENAAKRRVQILAAAAVLLVIALAAVGLNNRFRTDEPAVNSNATPPATASERAESTSKLGATGLKGAQPPTSGAQSSSDANSTDSAARNAEFEAIKAEMAKLSRQQEESSRALNDMDAQARNATKHIKPVP